MPLREIKRKFTKSEIFMLGWRSQEQVVHMKRSMKKPPGNSSRNLLNEDTPSELVVPNHLRNADGELDLRKATAQEAYQIFAAQGIRLPIVDKR